MTIKTLEINGFKGFRESTQIDFRPITLLFGPNSAGKSTVLHSLLFVRDVLDGNFGESEWSGRIDFTDVVHGHDLDQPINFTFELTPSPRQVHRAFGLPSGSAEEEKHVYYDRKFLPDVFSQFSIYLDIGCDSAHRPLLRGFTVSVDGKSAFKCDSQGPEGHYRVSANSDSPYWSKFEQLPGYGRFPLVDPSTKGWQHIGSIFTGGSNFLKSSIFGPVRDVLKRQPIPPGEGQFDRQVFGPLRILMHTLDDFIHIGPLRTIPDADFVPMRKHFHRWRDGFAAWAVLHEAGDRRQRVWSIDKDVLGYADATFIEGVNEWLHGEDGLRTGYWLELERFVQAPVPKNDGERNLRWQLKQFVDRALEDAELNDHAMPSAQEAAKFGALLDNLASASVKTRLKLRDKSRELLLSPKNLGSGISQVLPVIVAALDWEYTGEFVAVEQPELHVHPAVQTRMADLFIGRGKDFLIETHSEHILLRLLRRIRETFNEALPHPELALEPRDIAVNYIEENDGATQVTRLLIDETGDFVGGWPDGFFEERLPEVL